MFYGEILGQNRGFSLLETIVSMGLLALVAVAAGQAASIYNHSNNSANSIDDWTRLKTTVEQALDDPLTCASVLGIGSPTPPNLNGFNANGHTAVLNTLYYPSGAKLIDTSAGPQSSFHSLSVQSIQLKSRGKLGNTVDAELAIVASKMNNQSTKLASNKLETLASGSIFLQLNLNPNGSFRGCSSLRSASEYCTSPGYAIVMDSKGPFCHRVSCPAGNAIVGVDSNLNAICCPRMGMELSNAGQCVCPFGQSWSGGTCVDSGLKLYGVGPSPNYAPVDTSTCPTGACRKGG